MEVVRLKVCSNVFCSGGSVLFVLVKSCWRSLGGVMIGGSRLKFFDGMNVWWRLM